MSAINAGTSSGVADAMRMAELSTGESPIRSGHGTPRLLSFVSAEDDQQEEAETRQREAD
jgi:hypothetical protein